MLENQWLYLIIVGIAIIASLAFYAGKLLRQLKEQKQQLELAAQQKKIKLAEHDTKILNSVVIIARAMKEEQCDLSEGCWRLSVLLDSLKTTQGLSEQFPSIFKLYEEIKHMPILEERKKLDKKARMKLDFERMKVEAELSNNIATDLSQLLQYSNERISALKA